MNRSLRSQRRRVVTEKFQTRRMLRTRYSRLLRSAQARRASQDS
jgi:hypothetical protein